MRDALTHFYKLPQGFCGVGDIALSPEQSLMEILIFDTWLICGLIQPGGLHPHGVGLMWPFLVLKINGINKRVEWFRFALSTKKVVNLVSAWVVLS